MRDTRERMLSRKKQRKLVTQVHRVDALPVKTLDGKLYYQRRLYFIDSNLSIVDVSLLDLLETNFLLHYNFNQDLVGFIKINNGK